MENLDAALVCSHTMTAAMLLKKCSEILNRYGEDKLSKRYSKAAIILDEMAGSTLAMAEEFKHGNKAEHSSQG